MSRRPLFWTVVLIVAAGSLAACTVSVAAGVASFVGTLAVAALLLLTTSATQQGCDPDATSGDVTETPDDTHEVDYLGPCLSFVPDLPEMEADADKDVFGPCLGAPLDVPDINIGPCLSPPLDVGLDAGDEVDEDVFGPCLSPPLDVPDIGPCLSPPFDVGPDTGDDVEHDVFGPCLSQPLDVPDTSACLADVLDSDFGPCLSIIPPDVIEPADGEEDTPDSAETKAAPATARDKVIASLGARGVLPPDVLARLTGQGPEA